MPRRPATARPTDEEIRAVIELLASAERPVILAGAGVLRARTSTELIRFAELLQVPIIAAWRRADVVSNDHPLYLGMAGLRCRRRRSGARLDAADALRRHRLAAQRADDVRLHDAARRACRWAHVDLVPGRLDRLDSADPRRVVADAKAFLKAANERLARPGRPRRGTRRDAPGRQPRGSRGLGGGLDRRRRAVGRAGRPSRAGSIATLRRVLPDDAHPDDRRRQLRELGRAAASGSGDRGPSSVRRRARWATACRRPSRPPSSIAIVRSSRSSATAASAMTMAELETAVRVGARVVVVVFDNERYGTIRMWQERRGTGIGVATELGPVDFAAIARACGARGVRVERDDDFEPALRAALVADRATVIQLALDRAWLSIDDRPA